MPLSALLLVGGSSSRMGRSKAGLDWHGEPLAARLAGVLVDAVKGGPVVVVAAPGQALPPLPAGCETVADPVPGEGPLRGLATGLAALQGRADVAFVASVDMPLLNVATVDTVLAGLGDADAAVPVAGGRPQYLAAAYRVGVLAVAEDLLAAGELRLGALAEHVNARSIDAEAVGIAPTLVNVNTPEEYAQALAAARP
jgi:molybdopterin-guanine dinucleotide biosynthesis protein A